MRRFYLVLLVLAGCETTGGYGGPVYPQYTLMDCPRLEAAWRNAQAETQLIAAERSALTARLTNAQALGGVMGAYEQGAITGATRRLQDREALNLYALQMIPDTQASKGCFGGSGGASLGIVDSIASGTSGAPQKKQ